jgi:hypothetical protein
VTLMTLMVMTEMDIETSVYYVHLTRLIAREDFIKFTRRESTKTYTSIDVRRLVFYLWLYISQKANRPRKRTKYSSQHVL